MIGDEKYKTQNYYAYKVNFDLMNESDLICFALRSLPSHYQQL
jgi:hypothetical protein